MSEASKKQAKKVGKINYQHRVNTAIERNDYEITQGAYSACEAEYVGKGMYAELSECRDAVSLAQKEQKDDRIKVQKQYERLAKSD